MKYKYVCLVNEYEEYYYNMFEGEITSEKLAAIEKKKINLEDTIASCRMEIEKLMQSENDNSTAIAALDFEIAEAESHLEGLMPVYENAKDGMEYIERTGHSIQLIKPYSYDLLLQRDRSTRTRASLYILIGIIGAVSGIFAFDRQNNMNASLRSAYRGRWKLNITKTAIVFAVSVILCLALHMIQFVQIGKMFGYNNITSPLQSLMFMRDWKLQISIREYLILLFAARSLSAFLIGIICMGISRICTDTVSAMGVSAFLLAVPAIFTEFISESVFFNPLNLISGTFLM
ncbi:MAG: hypothetical protein MJ071_04210 [Oscillospiraceae bacterium]|nr:hypothetical protein [Oscillospiraceae bacterium]